MLQFTKMHGLGNDFIVIDGISQRFTLSDAALARLADPKTGIGFDQLLLLEPPTLKGSAFKYRIFNADGSEVSQCGNGARCIAKFIKDKALTDLNEFWVETNAGRMMLSILEDGQVRVNMGVPSFAPADIPLNVESVQDQYSLLFNDQPVSFSALEIGNPHAVFEVESIATAPVDELGRYLQSHASFPERVNVGFVERLSDNEINLRVYERGVGETLACGSGACAAVAAGVKRGTLSNSVKVNLARGKLQIDYEGLDKQIYLTGTATTIYHGKLDYQQM